jgi:hypothetical protein
MRPSRARLRGAPEADAYPPIGVEVELTVEVVLKRITPDSST